MTEIIVKKGVRRSRVMAYDSIRELPAINELEISKLFILDAKIGSDMPSVNAHHAKFNDLVKGGKMDDAAMEAAYLSTTYYFIMEGISLKSFCFVPFIYSINGEEKTDLGLEGIKRTSAELLSTGIPTGQLEDQLGELKKKLMMNMPLHFLIDTPVGT